VIVAIATLAWTIYNDHRTRTPDPPPSSIARQVRITLRDQDMPLPPGAERITEVVATEITRQATPPGSHAQDPSAGAHHPGEKDDPGPT